MTPFFSKRLLINLAVVAAAVGANAFVAYTQICGQRAADARTIRSMNIKRDLDAWRETLDLELAERTVIADTVGDTACIFLAGLYRAEQVIAERIWCLPSTGPLLELA